MSKSNIKKAYREKTISENQNVGTVVILKFTLFLGHENVDWFHLVQDRIQKWDNVD